MRRGPGRKTAGILIRRGSQTIPRPLAGGDAEEGRKTATPLSPGEEGGDPRRGGRPGSCGRRQVLLAPCLGNPRGRTCLAHGPPAPLVGKRPKNDRQPAAGLCPPSTTRVRPPADRPLPARRRGG